MIPHPYRSNTSSVSTPYTAQCCVTQYIHYITNSLSPNGALQWFKVPTDLMSVNVAPSERYLSVLTRSSDRDSYWLIPRTNDPWCMEHDQQFEYGWCCLLLLTVIQKFTFYSELFRILIHLNLNYFSLATHKALSFMCQRFQSTLAINA